MPTTGIRLFRVFGITVYLHWLWLLGAVYFISRGDGPYRSTVLSAVEYVGLFAIVLLHEFGHALACRSVGGSADTILLWPLGGVAYVRPPERPGAILWSIAAGPLVNLALLPVLGYFVWYPIHGDLGMLLYRLGWINFGLLVFNLLPVYPLDGGQILQSVLWFVMGRGRSLAVSAVIGGLGAVGLGVFAFYPRWNFWAALLAAFVASRCWVGWQNARYLMRAERMYDGRAFPIVQGELVDG